MNICSYTHTVPNQQINMHYRKQYPVAGMSSKRKFLYQDSYNTTTNKE